MGDQLRLVDARFSFVDIKRCSSKQGAHILHVPENRPVVGGQTLFRSQGINRIELCRASCGKISKYDPDYGGEQEADYIYLDIELEFQAH